MRGAREVRRGEERIHLPEGAQNTCSPFCTLHLQGQCPLHARRSLFATILMRIAEDTQDPFHHSTLCILHSAPKKSGGRVSHRKCHPAYGSHGPLLGS